MKTAIITSYGGLDKIEFRSIKIPAIKGKSLLIKVDAFALNPKDILIRKGKFRNLSGKKFPKNIGFEFAGVVQKTHKDSQIKKGDKVFGLFNGWQGQCSSEYIVVKEKLVCLMPPKVSYNEMSGIALAGSTALQALRNLGGIKQGSRVCINGASGGVGTLAIQIAKYFSANITAVSSKENHVLCQSLGSDKHIDYNETNILDRDIKYDIFFDVFGNYNFSKIEHLLAPHGTYITTVPSASIFIKKALNIFRNRKAQLVIVQSRTADLKWLANKVSQRRIKPIVDRVYSFEKLKLAQEYLETKRAIGKVVINFKKSGSEERVVKGGG